MSNKTPSLIDESLSRDYLYNSSLSTSDPSYHKSLDFSNVGLNITDPSEDERFRKYHQMRLYIQMPSVTSHGAALNLSGKTVVISSNLPQSFSYNLGSAWSAPLSFGNNPLVNLLMQTAGSAGLPDSLKADSGVSRITTLKIWNGSQPLSLNLTIPVLDDSANGGNGQNTNFVEALEYLSYLILPSYSSRQGIGFYTPPPTPLSASFLAGGVEREFKTNFGRVMLQLGGMLLVDNCIIQNIKVEYPNTKTMIKHTYAGGEFGSTGQSYLAPLFATITLGITTIEAMTTNLYSKMLWGKPQPSGKVVVDWDGAKQMMSDVRAAAKNMFSTTKEEAPKVPNGEESK